MRRAFLVPAAMFPLWYLAAPAGAVNPWWIWWAVAASFFVVAAASLAVPWVEDRLLGCFHACSSLITLQFFLLCSWNDMAPFFVVAWVMSVLATVLFIRSVPNLVRYGLFLVLAGGLLYAAEPDVRKLAYWGGILPVFPAWYIRLRRQEMSARRHLEHQEELERRVRERTRELADANRMLRREMEERAQLERQLRLAQTMEALGRLAGGVAHEFNNLLTAIRLYGELAIERLPEDSPVRHEIDRIQGAASEASAVTRQLLDFSRSGDAEHRPLDLNDLVREAASTLQPLMGDRIQVVWNLQEGMLPILGSPGPLQRVLLNLSLNARDAMGSGGRLLIETERLERGDPRLRDLPSLARAATYARMSVVDNGIGMDAETRDRVFDPFFSRKPVGKGTGLGLSIVYGIVRQTGGHVMVDSELGKGTRIDVLWPCTEEPIQGAEAAPRSSSGPHGNERILLVEDEPDLRSAVARILCRAGYRVTAAGDADAALAAADLPGEQFDLLVSDIVMPGKTGIELAHRLRTRHPGVPVLLISGHVDYRAASDGPMPPNVGFLHKPFDAEALRRKVRDVLSGSP